MTRDGAAGTELSQVRKNKTTSMLLRSATEAELNPSHTIGKRRKIQHTRSAQTSTARLPIDRIQPIPAAQTLRTSASFAFKIYNKKSGPQRRTLKYISCKFCEWEAIYDCFKLQEHIADCQAYMDAMELDEVVSDGARQSSGGRKARQKPIKQEARRSPSIDELALDQDDAPSLTAPDQETRPQHRSAEEVTFQLLAGFDELRTLKFRLIRAMHEQHHRDWLLFWDKYRVWEQTALAALDELRASGSAEVAQRLARALLTFDFNHSDFQVLFKVPFGEEVITVTGSDPCGNRIRESVLGSSRARDIAANDASSCRICGSAEDKGVLLQCDGCHGVFHSTCVGRQAHQGAGAAWTCAACNLKLNESDEVDLAPRDVTRFLSLAKPVGLKDEGLRCRQPPISLSQARQGMQWISRAGQSDFTFCLHCKCQKAVVPSFNIREPTTGTHEAVPMFFHQNPFHQNNALQHFRTVHADPNLSIEDMVRNHGTEVRPDSGLVDGLSLWEVAAHNNSVQFWYSKQAFEWETLRRKVARGIRSGQLTLRPREVSRSIAASSLTGSLSYLFRWPQRSEDIWILLCSNPACHSERFSDVTSSTEPSAHFKGHGLDLSLEGMLMYFGYKVIDDTQDGLVVGRRTGKKRQVS